MSLHIPLRSRLRADVGETGAKFLEHALNAITRILPHVEMYGWQFSTHRKSSVVWNNAKRLELRLTLGIGQGRGHSISCMVRRRSVPTGVGSIIRTIDSREKTICDAAISKLDRLCAERDSMAPDAISAMSRAFDELLVCEYLQKHYQLGFDPAGLLGALRRLAEQTYENRAYSFGCIVDTSDRSVAAQGAMFPDDFFSTKRYQALSDGYHTSYVASAGGRLTSSIDISVQKTVSVHKNYYPDWAKDFAANCRGPRIGFALNRQGDVLFFDKGTLRFTYRYGKWQYWNHSHLVDLLRNSFRVQKVPTNVTPSVANALYRTAMDVSFRRSGGLFVILRNALRADRLVRAFDLIANPSRSSLNAEFDKALGPSTVQLCLVPSCWSYQRSMAPLFAAIRAK